MISRISDPIGWLRDLMRRVGIGRALGRYYGIYRAQVIDNADPDNRGRVRLYIPALGHTSDADAPPDLWALPTGMSSGASDQLTHGFQFIPDVEDNVWVMFEDGLAHLPIYFTGWPSTAKGEERTVDAGPAAKGFFTKTGHRVEMDDETGKVLIQREGSSTMLSLEPHPGGDNVLISNNAGTNIFISGTTATIFGSDGSHVSIGDDAISMVNASGTFFSMKEGDLTIGASGNVVITSGAKISLQGSTDIGVGPIFEPAVLGTKFQTAWQAHTHVATGPGSPTTPGTTIPPLVPAGQLSTQVRFS
jgi:hypothetical protein